MRAYFFCNFYLSSIQQGIQAAHCLADMFVEYKHSSGSASNMLFEWAAKHKTMIVLNGGNDENLRETYMVFRNLCSELEYPYMIFNEDSASLNNARTCVGVVVPEKIYGYNDFERTRKTVVPGHDVWLFNPFVLNNTELDLAKIIDDASLAR